MCTCVWRLHPYLKTAPSSWLLQVRAWPKGSEKDAIPFLTNSWVADGYGGRIFFTGAPTLPAQTPDGLIKLRQQELANLRVGTSYPAATLTSAQGWSFSVLRTTLEDR